MKILSKKQWEKINNQIISLQIDYNCKCEQLEAAEEIIKTQNAELAKIKFEKENKEAKKNGRKRKIIQEK